MESTPTSDIAMNPEYPVYVISKGRWKDPLRQTSKALERMLVPYKLVVEPQEFNDYASVVDPAKILVLPFSNLGQGSIPARNWVWEHAAGTGARRHWIVDDNIAFFARLNRNARIIVETGGIFRAAEAFVDRYENVAIAGFNYLFFCKETEKLPPYYLNTRVYSCILLDNSLPYRWRGRYNEDTDLSLRILKDGWCSVLFNAFLCKKEATMRIGGGNTDELYQGDGRKFMAQSLVDQHPDVVKLTWKFDRWHHQVDYRPFRKNKLIKRADAAVPSGVNEYGMRLVELPYPLSVAGAILPRRHRFAEPPAEAAE